MRRLLCIGVLAGMIAASYASAEEPELKGKKERVSYSMGMDLGTKIKKQSVEFDADIFILGLRDALNEKKPLMSDKEIKEALTDLQKDLLARQAEQQKAIAEKNKKEGSAFLEENKKKEGVITLPSGLQYRAIKEGTGKTPKESDMVTTHYRGTFLDGNEFDSSFKRGQPATFPLKGIIPGWKEALQLMKEGSKWQLFIPSDLAYGERGAGPIGPNSTLIFEVELISVKESAKE